MTLPEPRKLTQSEIDDLAEELRKDRAGRTVRNALAVPPTEVRLADLERRVAALERIIGEVSK